MLSQVIFRHIAVPAIVRRVLSLCALGVLLAGCDHSLQIQGSGDILSATGTRNCTLEQQPCSQTVVDDYVETYTARPRSGWRFVAWENCGNNASSQCVFNVPAETVQQFWGKPVAPLIAKFERLGPLLIDAGATQTVVEKAEVQLQGRVLSGQATNYSWRQTGGRSVSLANAQTTNPRFTAPNIRNAEQLTFELTATGAASARALDSVMVEVKPRTYSAGGIVASEEIASVTNGRVWKVRYRSTTLRGESIIVSGWIAKPKTAAPEGGYPVLAFAHGTTGLADSCAPTNRSTPKATIPLLEDFLARGFVVAATDYQGLGEEGLHHYLVGPDEARSVLDSARAARQFAGASAQVVLFGHSQGGHAVIFANELARTLAPELQIMGTIGSGTGIADSTDNMLNYIKDSPYKGYLVMAGLAQNAAYGDDEVPLSSWFTPAGLQAAQAMNSICVDQLVSTYANLSSDYLFVDGFPLPGSGKYNPEADAVPGLRVGVSPLLMVHGRNDPQIRPDFLIPWVEDTCARGQPINLRWFDTGHRVPYEAPSAVKPVIADWIEDRFAGVPVVSDCGSVPRP